MTMTLAEYTKRNATNYGRALHIVYMMKAQVAPSPVVLQMVDDIIEEDRKLTEAVIDGSVDYGS
jgi:hypothetical protein